MENTVVLTAYLRTEKAKSLTSVPIYLRVTLNKQKALFSLGHYINPHKWDIKHQTAKGSDAMSATINKSLQVLKSKIFDIVADANKEGLFINQEILKQRLRGEENRRVSLLKYFSQYNQKIKNRIGVDYSLGTWKSYNTSYHKTSLFITENRKRSDLYLKELDIQFIDDLEYFLKVEVKLSNNSTMKYLQCLIAVVNDAVRKNHITKNPFLGFKRRYENVKRDLLTTDEVDRLKKQKINSNNLNNARDIFLFCCYTGLAYVDVSKLAVENIIKGIDGNLWVEIYRAKTNVRSPIPLLPEALVILKRQRFDEKIPGQRIFEVYTNQAINRLLKDLAKKCKINKLVTFHMARHTFATTITLSNNVPIETVSKMLGHTNLTTTQIYAKVIDNKISDDMKRLTDKLGLK